MSDAELSAARRVLSRLSPAAFVGVLNEAERGQLLDALMRDAKMKVVTLRGSQQAAVTNGGYTPIVVCYSQSDDERVTLVSYPIGARREPSQAALTEATPRAFVSRGDGPLHWVPAWGTLREVHHAIGHDSTACGLSVREPRRMRVAPSDTDFRTRPSGRCRRCSASFDAADRRTTCGRPDPDPRMAPCSAPHAHDGPHVHSGEIVRPDATVDDWNEALAAWTRRQP